MLLALLLLLHSFYFLPHQVACLPHHLYSLSLLRVVEFEHILYLPDAGQSLRQVLDGALLLAFLLPLLLATLLLTTLLAALRHGTPLRNVCLSTPVFPRFLYPHCAESRRGP